jgi:hypothetical protein
MRSSLPGLTRQSIDLRKDFLAKKMDARVKPAHDGGIIFYHTAVFACGDGTGIRAI